MHLKFLCVVLVVGVVSASWENFNPLSIAALVDVANGTETQGESGSPVPPVEPMLPESPLTSGSTGVSGSQGSTRFPGSQGSQGSNGSQGSTGFQGSQGSQGSQGNQGSQGSQGTQGSQGSQGSQGFPGSQGSQGNQGSQGSQGTQGSQGSQGFPGSQGSQGSQGFPGSQGSQGTPTKCSSSPQGRGRDEIVREFNAFMKAQEKFLGFKYTDFTNSSGELFDSFGTYMTEKNISPDDSENLWCQLGTQVQLLNENPSGQDITLNHDKVKELINALPNDQKEKDTFLNSVQPCADELVKLPSNCDLREIYSCLRRKCEEATSGGNNRNF